MSTHNHHLPDAEVPGFDRFTPRQREAFAHYRSYAVPAEWFIGATQPDGAMSVVAIGDNFAWSFQLGEQEDASSEARLSDWQTGIEV